MTQEPAIGKKTAWNLVGIGFASLIVSTYYDISRGPIVTPMTKDLGLNLTEAGAFIGASGLAATATTAWLIWALNRWSERSVMIFAAASGVAAALTAQMVQGFGTLLVLAMFLGITIAILGTMANILLVEGTPEPSQGRMLSSLHAVYGLVSMGTASFAGWALGQGLAWSKLILVALPFYAMLLLASTLKLPKHGLRRVQQGLSPKITRLQSLIILAFAFYVAGEVTMSLWMTTYLVKAQGFAMPMATRYLTVYFFLLMLTRLACAAFVKPSSEPVVLRLALLLPTLAAVVGWSFDWPEAFVVMGIFGPFFPLCLARMGRRFPEKWRVLAIWATFGLHIAVAVADYAVGSLADQFGIKSSILLSPIFLFAAFIVISLYLAFETNRAQA